MKFTKHHQKDWESFQKKYKREKKRLRFTDPTWSFQLDKNTKIPKVKLCYTIPYEKNKLGDNKIRWKNEQDYSINRTIKDYDILVRKEDLQKYHDRVIEIQDRLTKGLTNDDDGVDYWVKIYIQRNKTEMKTLSNRTMVGDEFALMDFIEYLETNKKSKSIYSIDKDMVYDYLQHRFTFGSDKGNNQPWTPSTVNSSYRRIRAWYNWMSSKPNTDLQFGFLNGMGKRLPKIELDTTTFTKKEITAVYKFIEEMKGDLEWGWFIPILRTLLMTGARKEEVVFMKVDDVDLDTWDWTFVGKGNKTRTMPIQNEILQGEIKRMMVDKDGLLINKEYVFHKDYYRKSPSGLKGYKKGQHAHYFDLDSPYSLSGVSRKFKKMVRHLKLNDKLSPHACRRFYITEMLKKTNGNVPLVAQLVGHTTWDIVRLYAKNVVPDETLANINLKDIIIQN